MVTKQSRKADAIYARHANIEERDVGTKFIDFGQDVARIGNVKRLVALDFEQIDQCGRHVDIGIDHKNASAICQCRVQETVLFLPDAQAEASEGIPLVFSRRAPWQEG